MRFRTFFVFLQPTGKIPADSTLYEKDFPQTNATIATLQVSQLVFNYLSIATRAFSIITYCHTRAKNGGFSAKKQRNTFCFRRKTLKKWRKRLAVSNIFCIFATNRKNSCRFHLEAYDSCETTFYIDSCETTFYIIIITKTYDTSRFYQNLLR